MIGTVKGFEIGKNRDGTKNVLLLQVEMSDPDDIQTVEYFSGAGDDTIPPEGSLVTILSVGSAWKIAIASNDNIAPTMDEGERKIYSSSGGAIKAFINFLKDGTLEINGNSDFAVAFNDLKAGFDSFVATFNSHMHPTAATGPPSPPITPSTDNIDASKISEVKLP